MSDPQSPPRARRSRLALLTERAIEVLVHLSGFSAILFVFGIFFFVFKEGAPFLSKLDIGQFLFSSEWIPTSNNEPK